MSDVDDDFMCEDEEDYGLVSEFAIYKIKILLRLCSVSFCNRRKLILNVYRKFYKLEIFAKRKVLVLVNLLLLL